ncbi:MAG: protein kinase [Myxococcaceae bacterium]|nr:protein kinase [Myxococcaceae bacterium]MCA3014884.1 protein kinase [Myxococcaceae bacterium]
MQTVPNRLGRYHLRYRIAVGGMGGVYLAKATGALGADKVVAVKLLHEHLTTDESMVTMFLDEARIATAINHVNVSTVFDFGEQEGLYFLVMEYLEGEPLDRVLKSMLAGTDRHPLHPWLVARVVADAAEGLHAAHELVNAEGQPLDVVHRDVSPHNLFVTYDGVVKVVDFGIARARERSTATDAGQFKGKFEYASPEQLRVKSVDRRADVWGLGVCLWELLTCRRLFQREDAATTGRAVMSDPIAPPSSVADFVPPGLDAVVMKALERSPARRHQTTRELGRALREALAQSGEVVDQTDVGEWLEALFPGDRARRQALVAAVRRSGPDAPLESVPEELRVKGTNSGSASRSYRSSSSSGRRTLSERGASTGGGAARNDEPAAQRTLEVEPEAPRSRRPLVVGLAAASGVLVAGAIVVLLRTPGEPPFGPAVDGSPAVATGETPTERPSAAAGERRRDDAEEPARPGPAGGALAIAAPADPPRPTEGDAVGAQAAAARADSPRPTEGDAVGAQAVAARADSPRPTEGDAVGAQAVAARADSIRPVEGDVVGEQAVVAGPVTAGPSAPQAATARPAAGRVSPTARVAGQPAPPGSPIAAGPKAPSGAPSPSGAAPDTSPARGTGEGRVRFKTPGATAEVLIDGKVQGTTPLTLDLPSGTHVFELRAKGYDFGGPQQLKVSVGREYDIDLDLH